MNRRGLVAFVILSLTMAAAMEFLSVRAKERSLSGVQIGVPDDSKGLIIDYILRERGFEGAEAVRDLESYAMKDCCASSSEWALSTDMLDMALMCPDAAVRLVEKDPRFELVGPAMLNSDVLVVRHEARSSRIGIAHRRPYQERLVREKLAGNLKAVPLLPATLPYAYERGAVDGVVVDIFSACGINGERISSAADGVDVVTCVLVARKHFAKDPFYRRFMKAYQRAVMDLDDARTLIRAVESYKSRRWTDKEVEEWKRLKVKVVFPLQEEN